MAKKRNFKREYALYQSSTKMKKYRASLNKYNRQHGTYGNGDNLDASHKHGKIVGYESSHTNKGRTGEGGRKRGRHHRMHNLK